MSMTHDDTVVIDDRRETDYDVDLDEQGPTDLTTDPFTGAYRED